MHFSATPIIGRATVLLRIHNSRTFEARFLHYFSSFKSSPLNMKKWEKNTQGRHNPITFSRAIRRTNFVSNYVHAFPNFPAFHLTPPSIVFPK